MAFFLISLGQFIGAVIAGYASVLMGMETVFFVAAGLCLGLIALRPRVDAKSMKWK
jgi:hypothetical protein